MGVWSNILGVLGLTFTTDGPVPTGLGVVLGNAPGTPAYNPTWFALANTGIYWDPQAGNDSNSGGPGQPILTWGEAVRRFGSSEPTPGYGKSIIVNQLSTQPPGQDPPAFRPKMSGGGRCVLLGALAVVQAAFVAGVVTPPTVGAGGSLLTVATMPAGTVANQYVYNQTRQSYAFIDSMSGTTANMQQPLHAAALSNVGSVDLSTAPADNTWTTGDTLVIYALPSVNLKDWNPDGADATGAVNADLSVGWVQWVAIADPSGAQASTMPLRSRSCASVLSGCLVLGALYAVAENATSGGPANGAGNGCYLQGCSVVGQVTASGTIGISGGGFADGILQTGGVSNLRNGVAVHGSHVVQVGTATLISVFESNGITVYTGAAVLMEGAIWGAFNVTVLPGGAFVNNNGATSWASQLLTSGALYLGANTVGSAYSAGQFTDGIALTPANLDAYESLQAPRTGGRYCKTSGQLVSSNGNAIMWLGDSNFTGSDSGTGGSTTGYLGVARLTAERTLRNTRSDFNFIGTLYTLPDTVGGQSLMFHCAVPGTTIAAQAAAYPGYVATEGVGNPDIVVVMLGTNDVVNGRTAAQMEADWLTLEAAIYAANPSTIILALGVPLFYPSSGRTQLQANALNAVSATFNAWLAGRATTDRYFYSNASQVSVGETQADGEHLNQEGAANMGEQIGILLAGLLNPNASYPIVRGFVQRQPWSAVQLSATAADGVKVSNAAAYSPGTALSFAFAIDVYPTQLIASFKRIAQYRPAQPTYWSLWANGTQLGLFWFSASSAFNDTNSPSKIALVPNKWHRIVFIAYALPPPATTGTLGLWVNGQLVGFVDGVADWTHQGLDNLLIGYNSEDASQALPGFYGRVSAYSDTASPGLIPRPGTMAAQLAVEGDYYHGRSLVQGACTSQLSLNNLLADDVYSNPSAVLVGGAAFVPASPGGVPPRPWEYSAQDPGNTNQATPPSMLYEFAAFASLTTAAAQALPPGSGATSSTADLTLGAVATAGGTLSRMSIQFTGNAANVGGQTITAQVYKNGAAVTPAIIAGIATTAGNKAAQLTFAPTSYVPGDVLSIQLLPSALLTNALADVMASVS